MERVVEEEKEKRPDLHVLALAYVFILIVLSKLEVGINRMVCLLSVV